MRSRPVATVALVLAGVADLPVVYYVVAELGSPPLVSVALGLLAMGLAWAGGCALEGRRRRTLLLLSLLGTLQALLALVPALRGLVPDAALAWVVASAAFSVVGLVTLLRT